MNESQHRSAIFGVFQFPPSCRRSHRQRDLTQLISLLHLKYQPATPALLFLPTMQFSHPQSHADWALGRWVRSIWKLTRKLILLVRQRREQRIMGEWRLRLYSQHATQVLNVMWPRVSVLHSSEPTEPLMFKFEFSANHFIRKHINRFYHQCS